MTFSSFSKPLYSFCYVLILSWLSTSSVYGQYFGKNKPKYTQQPFEVLETPHLEWYHYLKKNRALLERIALESESWHAIYSQLFNDSLSFKNPIILYNDHADFQQTQTIYGNIDPAVGGVTEALKNRVVIPLAFTHQQTNHVLGHELVHAFQFQAIQQADSTDLDNLRNIPLWLIEGMAEYFSLGRIDPHTAMWMRDAVISDDIPTIADMSDFGQYFPYRFGHAFIAFLSGVYGDDVIVPFFMRTALVGLEQACQDLFGADTKALSDLWVASQKRGYSIWLRDSIDVDIPAPLLSSLRWISRYNQMAPSISPDGKYVIFLSDLNGLSMDLFLAETETGDVLHKIHSSDAGTDIDELQFLESSGTWSPDNRHFAYVGFQHGRNVLITVDVQKPRKKKIISINGLKAFTQPAWSPDGKSILLTGMKNGQVDLYLYTLRNKKLSAITQDAFSEIHPTWSPDGQHIYFASDQYTYPLKNHAFQLVRMSSDGTEKTNIDIFPGANNLNPQVDSAGNIYFLSDRDGFRQLYRWNVQTEEIKQLTDFKTGISGLTTFTPAISLSRQAEKPTIVYSLFKQKGYDLRSQTTDQLEGVEVDPEDVHFSAGILPPRINEKSDIVQKNLIQANTVIPDSLVNSFRRRPYKTRLGLDYIGGGTGMGINTSNAFGANTALVGGIDMLFTDMLGDHLLFAGIAMNGEILDAGGMIQYLNRKKRIFWGINASHIPFRSGALFYKGPVNIIDEWGNTLLALQYDLLVNRVFQDQINGIVQFPFSVNKRLELGLGYALFYQRRDLISQYYNEFGQFIGQERMRIPSPGNLNMFNNMLAYVGDNAQFGIASPMRGWRHRLAVEAFWGDLQYQTTLFDFRRYATLRPFVHLAFRTIQYNRLGKDKNKLFPLYAIDPMLVRGYQRLSLDDLRRDFQLASNQISGSNLWVGNIELRIPFSGHRKIALIPSRLFLTEIAWFVDAGVAWSKWQDFKTEKETRPALVTSTGLSLRINLFGALIIEPYYAIPLTHGNFHRGSFGINLIPGW